MLDDIAYFFDNVFPVHMFFAIQLLLAELMFYVGRDKRSKAPLRIALCILAYLCLSLFHPVFGDKFLRVLAIFCWSVVFLAFTLESSFKCCVFIAMGAYGIQNMAFNVGELAIAIFKADGFTFYLVSAIAFVIVYIISYFLFVRQYPKEGDIKVKNLSCMLLAVITLAVVYSKNVLLDAGVPSADILSLMTSVGCALVLAVLLYSIRVGEIIEQRHIVEQLLKNEKARFDMLKENMDLINMKCHDLRYHVQKYRQEAAYGKHDKFFDEIDSAIGIYDAIPLTGNQAFDVLLNEKNLFCRENKINLTYLVDSAALEKFDVSDIYSLFGNAVDNAIQSVLNEELEKRIISINVKKRGDFAEIVCTNYCSKAPKIEGGLPISEKDSRYHGYGTKSIKYIVEKYGGSMLVDTSDDMFTLGILLPQA